MRWTHTCLSAKHTQLAAALTVLSTLLTASSPAAPQALAPTTQVRIDHYDLVFDIDAAEKTFRSRQTLALTALREAPHIVFDLHGSLLIDDLRLRAEDGSELTILSWTPVGEEDHHRPWGTVAFTRFQVRPAQPIARGQRLHLSLNYHLDPTEIRRRPGDELLRFAVTAEGSRALHPAAGIVPLFDGNRSAPFRMTITYPGDQLACVPGRRTASDGEADRVTQTFQTEMPLIPVFAIGPYREVARSAHGVTVECYLIPGQSFAEEAFQDVFDIVQWLQEHFGDPGTDCYRFAFVDVRKSSTTGENKGNAIYIALRPYDDPALWRDEEARLPFTQFIAHEIFHNWNLFFVNWQGKLYEWFGEGGAGFMAAWSCERLFGEKAGRTIRSGYVNGLIRARAHQANSTLEEARKTGPAQISLIYSYGALVWEQLRLKLGDEALLAGLGDFFRAYGHRPTGYADLLSSLQTHTQIPVDHYLSQWTRNNARIDLVLADVDISDEGDGCRTTVTFDVDADQDYELFTAVGYRTAGADHLIKIAQHTTRKGRHSLTFASEERPVFIQLDPDFRVPQIRLGNEIWEK